jgi:hypothetical protein
LRRTCHEDLWRLAEKNAGLSDIPCVRPCTSPRDSVSRVYVVSVRIPMKPAVDSD